MDYDDHSLDTIVHAPLGSEVYLHPRDLLQETVHGDASRYAYYGVLSSRDEEMFLLTDLHTYGFDERTGCWIDRSDAGFIPYAATLIAVRTSLTMPLLQLNGFYTYVGDVASTMRDHGATHPSER